jgi:hypothetical protein
MKRRQQTPATSMAVLAATDVKKKERKKERKKEQTVSKLDRKLDIFVERR